MRARIVPASSRLPPIRADAPRRATDPFTEEPPKHGRRAGPVSGRRASDDRLVLGCMTGTSIDGLDVALVCIRGNGLTMRVELRDQCSRELGTLASRLRSLAGQQPCTAGDIAAMGRDLALIHLDACRELTKGQHIDLVCVHGQTVFHAPPLSWQLFSPAVLAHGLHAPVVSDLRAADLAAGGQGAPITPLADWILLRHAVETRAVINLGGFVNLTRLPADGGVDRVSGGDVCACNQVLDAVARTVLDRPFDENGAAALEGRASPRAVADLGRRLGMQAKAGRSLGTGDELASWLERFRDLAPEDLARSACAAIAAVVAKAAAPANRLILAGGGTRNRALVAELTARAGVPVQISDELGVPATLREAMAFAVLGALCQDGVPITLPAITGVDRAPVAGCWTWP